MARDTLSRRALKFHHLRPHEAGVGIACSLESSVQSDVERGLLGVIDFNGPELRFQIRQVATNRRPPSQSVLELMQHLRLILIT